MSDSDRPESKGGPPADAASPSLPGSSSDPRRAALEDDAPDGDGFDGDGQREIDCRKLVELLTDYVDGELPRSVSEAMDRHMGACAPCIAFVREYRFAGESARRVLIRQVPDGLEERLLSFLKKKCGKSC